MPLSLTTLVQRSVSNLSLAAYASGVEPVVT